MEIYLDYGLVLYTRTYNKIVIIISNIIPLYRLVLYIFQKITRHIKLSLIKRDLAGLIFVNNTITKSIKIDNDNKDNNKNQSSQNIQNIPFVDNSQEGINKNIKTIPIFKKSHKTYL